MSSPIQSLWIGERLSTMEQLCIRSFLCNGHDFHLYVYQDIAGIPSGTVILDANQVLPESRVFLYREYKSYAGFANFFRYKLLLEKGGWFVDADTICVKPFDFGTDYVFSTESASGYTWINVGAIKVPPGSTVMKYAWDACEQMNVSELQWGQCGPALLQEAVHNCSLEHYATRAEVFCPVRFPLWNQVLDPTISWDFDADTHAVHLWNELWRRFGQDKDATYPPECLYEQLKARYLP